MGQTNQNESQGWDARKISDWYNQIVQKRVRTYDDVVQRIQRLPANSFQLEQYGTLSIEPSRYPLLSVTAGDLENGKPNILIMGGVHGYEPSGVEAALEFLENEATSLTDEFNFAVYPCISPWAYEYDHRWNADAEDPNRQFLTSGGASAEESVMFMISILGANAHYKAAVDLHETPDRDIELRQQRADRFGSPLGADYKIIPNGFYLILTNDQQSTKPDVSQFGRMIVDEVAKVSPIADHKVVIGQPNHNGLIYPPLTPGTSKDFLQAHADYIGVSEVYPDHPKVGPAKAIEAQRAVIHGALNFVRGHSPA
jgi:hypothetical protein